MESQIELQVPLCLSEALPWVEKERSSLSQLEGSKIISKKIGTLGNTALEGQKESFVKLK